MLTKADYADIYKRLSAPVWADSLRWLITVGLHPEAVLYTNEDKIAKTVEILSYSFNPIEVPVYGKGEELDIISKYRGGKVKSTLMVIPSTQTRHTGDMFGSGAKIAGQGFTKCQSKPDSICHRTASSPCVHINKLAQDVVQFLGPVKAKAFMRGSR